MDTAALTITILLSGTLVYCEPQTAGPDRTITVCVQRGTLGGLTVPRATSIATKMFQDIGVTVNWRSSLRSCPTDALVIRISTSTPTRLKPDAFAYALPYEGTHIEVFYDRIHALCPGQLGDVVLAHVMVHEITHILEGVIRHSEQGVMKSKWSGSDYAQMIGKPLTFAPENIHLIYFGLAARQQRALAAKNNKAEEAVVLR